MKNAAQFPTWGVYGFFKAIFELLQMEQPDGIAIAFDKGKRTFRTEMYPEYKAHRQAMPDSLSLQMGKIFEGVQKLGIPIFQVENFEADDLIGTLARQAAEKSVDVTVLTGDQDAFQIIDPAAHISILVPSFKGGLTRYDRHKVFEKWGVWPEQVTDFKGLKGDTSDNIPGVPGIGDKTAAKLLADYQTLEGVLENTEAVSGKKLKESLLQYRDQAILSKQLATIVYDAPVQFEPEACHLEIPDLKDFIGFLSELEFRSFIAQSQTLLAPFLTGAKPLMEDAPPSPAILAPETTQLAMLEMAAESLQTSYFTVPHTVVTTESELEAFLNKVKQTGVLTLDFETSGLDTLTAKIAGIAMSWSPDVALHPIKPINPLALKEFDEANSALTVLKTPISEIETIYVPLNHETQETQLPQVWVLERLKAVLADPNIMLVAHNAKYELNILRHHGLTVAGPIFDTMVASYVLDSSRKHGLKSLCHEVLGKTMQEITELIGKGKNQLSFTQVPIAEASPYATCDAWVTLQLASIFTQQLKQKPTLQSLLYELELPLVPVLAQMEAAGVSLDTAYLRKLHDQLDARLVTVEAEIYELAGVRFNLNSPKQVAEVFFEKLQLPTRGLTASKSSYTTNAKVIETLAYEYPIAQKLLDYRQLFKLKSTYVDALPALIHPKDNRLHTSYNQTITATGRLSSSDPNLQNIPIRSELGRSIRQAFVPREPHQWRILSADYSQIELRLLAHFSQDEAMVEAFRSGEDIHKATAALVFDVPLEAVTKEMRYQAKAVNFGIIYGQTAFGLSNALSISPKEAAEFIARYFERYPKVKAYIEDTKAIARGRGYAETLYGRVRDFSQDLGSSNKSIREFAERAAFNMPLQGSASDLVKLAMIRLQAKLNEGEFASQLILQVHDEVVLEVHDSEREAIKALTLWAMELEQPLNVPLVVDISDGPSWMEVD